MAIFAPLLFLLTTSLSLLSANYLVCANQEKKVYIVYMGAIPKNGNKMSLASVQIDLLSSVLEDGSPEEFLIRSYGRSFNGFAAKLTESERIKLSGKSGVLSVFPDEIYSTHTTRSWDFLGLNINSPRNLKLERDVIVGIIDTGIWPEAESFDDKGLGPPPKKWKGTCEHGFPCNNKIIGARSYTSGLARDTVGHGTHTAATIAGALVNNASLNHLGEGTARGGVPSARLSVYSVCTSDGCTGSSILAAFDDAIADGVDMISISIGYSFTVNYLDDPIAIASFHAMANGILTSASAGNNGPSLGSVANVAPWLMTVAASSIDRKFITKVVLGSNEVTVEGISVNPFDTEKQPRPLISSCDAIEEDQVGKILFCHTKPVINGAFGQVFVVELLDFAPSYDIPTSVVKQKEGDKITVYINQTREAVAKILRSEEAFDSDAPTVASFSSRGPNQNTPDILKPDISSPGVNILAAWSPKNLLTGYEKKYNILSGTSMACPHVTAAAAYVKSFHPTWSPAALRSALMTTATPMSSTKNGEAEFAYGSGQINPTKAVDPGLIYETTDADYVRMLCSEGWTIEQIRLITGNKKSSCPDSGNKPTVWDLNYPSIAYNAQNTPSFNVSFPRRVTNVGSSAGSGYKVRITSDSRISIGVSPNVLKFKSLNEELSYTVTVSGLWMVPKEELQVYSGAILWSDGKHSVRSPVVVYH